MATLDVKPLKSKAELETSNKPMTVEEFRHEMANIYTFPKGDTEITHIMADELMVKLLKQLGYGEGAEIFENMDKWYA